MIAAWSAVLSIAFASGLNLYATVLTLGLLGRYQVIELSGPLHVLSSAKVLAVAAFLYAIEFVADKIPWVDSIWDVVHAFVRPVGAAVLAYSAVGSVHPELQMLAALVAGGIALTSHTAKASTRAVVNLSPEPFSNWVLSFAEDAIAVGVVWLAAKHPWLALAIVLALIALAVILVIKFARFIRTRWSGKKR